MGPAPLGLYLVAFLSANHLFSALKPALTRVALRSQELEVRDSTLGMSFPWRCVAVSRLKSSTEHASTYATRTLGPAPCTARASSRVSRGDCVLAGLARREGGGRSDVCLTGTAIRTECIARTILLTSTTQQYNTQRATLNTTTCHFRHGTKRWQVGYILSLKSPTIMPSTTVGVCSPCCYWRV